LHNHNVSLAQHIDVRNPRAVTAERYFGERLTRGRTMISRTWDQSARPIVAQGDEMIIIIIWLALISVGACTPNNGSKPDRASAVSSVYAPRTREVTITTVPLLVKEEASVLPFLKEDFSKGGVLDGKEVYGFSPSAVTVVEGDTVHFTFINPEDDVHSFVLPDLVVPLPPQKITTTTYIAKRAGIFPFVCSVTSHLPMMSGQLVVLSNKSMR
jgi:plastocyanin